MNEQLPPPPPDSDYLERLPLKEPPSTLLRAVAHVAIRGLNNLTTTQSEVLPRSYVAAKFPPRQK